MEQILLWAVNIIFILVLLFGGIYYVDDARAKSYKKGFEAGENKGKNETFDQCNKVIQSYIADCQKLEKQITQLEKENDRLKNQSTGKSEKPLILAEAFVNKMLAYNGKTLIEIDDYDKGLIDVEKNKEIKYKQGLIERGVCFVYSNARYFVRLDNSLNEEIFQEDDWVNLKFHCVRMGQNDINKKYQLYLTS